MTDRLNVDIEHIARCGNRIVEHGRELSALVSRLQDETAAGPRWDSEHGGRSFTATYTALAQAALGTLDLLARDLDDLGTNLRIVAAEMETSDVSAESAMRRIGRGL